MKSIIRAFEENGWVVLSKFGFGLLDATKNALKFAPMEYKYLLSILLAAMWCIAFGIYTVDCSTSGITSLGTGSSLPQSFSRSLCLRRNEAVTQKNQTNNVVRHRFGYR